jgi:hypothetical protein
MSILVIYESMFGNTHTIAEEIAHGMRCASMVSVAVVPVDHPAAAQVEGADLLVVGGPTHAHGLSWPRTRVAAAAEAARPDAEVTLDADAEGAGLRTWFHDLDRTIGTPAAAFDTRFAGPSIVTGSAAHAISRRLRNHGFTEIAPCESFLVDKHNQLLDGELQRAHEWGASLARALHSRAAAR